MPIIGILMCLVILALPTWIFAVLAIVTIFLATQFVQTNFGGRSGVEVLGMTLGIWFLLGIAKFALFHLHWVW